MIRLTALILATAAFAPALRAQPSALDADPNYREGLAALQDQLPDLALTRFERAREAVQNDPAAGVILAMKIGEASVRAARMEPEPAKATQRAEAALAQLSIDSLQGNEVAIFWAGQASLLLGRFGEAAGRFGQLAGAKDLDLRNRSQLARAQLLAAVGDHAEAHKVLRILENADDPEIAEDARLLLGSLLLEEGRLDEVEALFPAGDDPAVMIHRQHRNYLLARLAQARGDHQKAAALFRPLADHPEQLSAAIHHGAIVGLAEALHAESDDEEQTEEAIDILINLIDKHPHTPLLEGALARLVRWSQTNETVKNRVLERLRTWSNAPSGGDLEAATPQEPPNRQEPVLAQEDTERAGYALYYYARYLAEKNEADSNKLAAELLETLRNKYPNHLLAPASLLESARLQSAANQIELAIATLNTLEAAAPSDALKAEAAKLIALLAFKERDFATAALAFNRARALLESTASDLAATNAGISLLRAGDRTTFDDLLASLHSPEARLSLELEQALYLVSRGEGDSRAVLDRFLHENPTHPRVPEAQLAYAAELLRLEPEKPLAQEEARARLAEINPSQLGDAAALRHLLVHLHLAHLTGAAKDWKNAIERTKGFIESRQSGDLNSTLRLKLAEAYYMNGNLRKARIEFENIAEKEQTGLLYEVALLFAAKAALKLGTEKSPEEAMELLRKVIAAKGVTATEARLLLARSQLQLSPTAALATLQPLLDDPTPGSNQVQALVLAAEAHRALGAESNYRESIRIYDRVLAREDLPYDLSNRFHSLKGRAYELLGETDQALESYYRVLNRENLRETEEPTEWYWFTECGFKAVQLLEQGKRWKSALQLLRKISESGSPRAAEAAERFKRLQLEHRIWELD